MWGNKKLENKYLTTAQVGELLNTNRVTLSRWAKKGTLIPEYIDPSGYKHYTKE